MTSCDVNVSIDDNTMIRASVVDRSVGTCGGILMLGGEVMLTHDTYGLDRLSLAQFIERFRHALDELEAKHISWDEERLRQASEDAAAELDDSVLPPFMGHPEHRHAPTNDHLLSSAHPSSEPF